MPNVEHNIDLQCLLCIKNPKFSDVSHLLTHISSKSHLAARFKLEIQAQSDGGARSKLDGFNFWYRASNIDALLADRMAAKEHKKTKNRRNLTEAYNVPIKTENDQQSVFGSMRATPFAETPVQGFRAPVPRMHLWPTATNTTTYTEWEQSPPAHVYETPTARRQVPNFGRPETPPAAQLDPLLTTPWKADPEDAEKGTCIKSGEKLTDSAKLKGVIYPGMDLFDSATPEMKRKRNQKKDGAILGQMLATSKDTEPAEVSYHPNGDFRASRDIFGPLSTENSPEPPSLKKRKSRKPTTTTTLFNIPVNAPRQRAPRGKKAAAGSPQKQRNHPTLLPPPVFFQPAPSLNSTNAGLGRRYVPANEEDEEFRLTVEDMGKKRNFSIFQDATQASPARTETPLEDDQFDFIGATRDLTSYSSEAQSSSRFPVSPTPVPKPASYRPCGKENGMPELPAQQNARRAPSAPASLSHGYPPQMFHNHSSLNPLYNPTEYARSFGGFANPSYHMTNVPMGFGTMFHGDFKPSGPMLQQQESQGEDMGAKNDFENSMDFNI